MITESLCFSVWERNGRAQHCVTHHLVNIVSQCVIRCSLHYPEEKNLGILWNLKMSCMLLVLLYCIMILRAPPY
jgi:hypothetical protein